jgi:hypothetical protein
MRTIHDLTGIGVALVGNETVYTRLEGHGRQAQFAQLYSRVGMRISKNKVRRDDVNILLNGWNIMGEAERGLLFEIARKPGGLRGMTKTIRLAFLSSGGDVNADNIRKAYEKISNTRVIADAA